jgi:hypothetical protein
MPAGYEEDILSADFANIGGSDRYYTEIDEDMNIDYIVSLRILTSKLYVMNGVKPNVHISGCRDGWEYVLDQNGNAMKDLWQ